jgi:hypothetical protein
MLVLMGTWGGSTATSAPGNGEQHCGPADVQALTAAHDIDIGSTIIANDEENLWVELEVTGSWLLGTTHVHVGLDGGDYPTGAFGQPLPDHFDYTHERSVVAAGDGVGDDVFVIPLAELGTAGPCDTAVPIYIWAHAEAFRFHPDGSIQQESAYGGDLSDSNPDRWFFLAQYDLQCCNGAYRTQGQGGWGTPCRGNNPGCLRDQEFGAAFPDGLTIGCNKSLTLSSSAAVEAFLPTGGKPGVLLVDHVDPTQKTRAGVLAGHLVAATLSLGFDTNPDPLSELALCRTNTACDGLTLDSIVGEANRVMGGCSGSLDLSAAQLSECLAIVNANYVGGEDDAGQLCPAD